MILITGASGHVGRRVAELLSKDELPMRLMAHESMKVPLLPHAEYVIADYVNTDSLDRAMKGIERAFIVSGQTRPGERAKLHRNAFQAAARAGVKHVVYLSFQNASPDSKSPFGCDHYESEQYLAEAGVPFTALRDSIYMDLLSVMPNEQGVIRGPAENGKAAFVSREDVAQVAAVVLKDPQKATGFFNVTGPEAISLGEAAERLAKICHRDICYQNETVEEARKWRSQGAEEWEVNCWVGSYLAIAAGEVEQLSDTVQRLTGREPMTLEAYFNSYYPLVVKLKAA
jgi:NAD(P)H dehydrogenase (quinone)